MARTEFDWMREIQDVANRFKDYFESPERPGPRPAHGPEPERARTASLQPNSELYIEDGKYCVEVELPGMKKEDIRITVAGDAIEVSGERKPGRNSGTQVLRSNRAYGPFLTRIQLPKDADFDLANASASYQDGILRILLPKNEVSGFSISIE
jgi:HSP20 family protein